MLDTVHIGTGRPDYGHVKGIEKRFGLVNSRDVTLSVRYHPQPAEIHIFAGFSKTLDKPMTPHGTF